MTVAPRRNLASPLLSRTWALHGGGDGPDQMMAHATLALYPLVFLPAAETKLAIALSDVIRPAMCPGLVYNGLLTAILGVSLGNQAGGGGRDLGISILPAPPASSELIREACTGVFHLD